MMVAKEQFEGHCGRRTSSCSYLVYIAFLKRNTRKKKMQSPLVERFKVLFDLA